MKFPNPLIEAKLIKRYKRFLTDVILPDGSEITVHCPNTGSMKRCMPENARIWISDSQNDRRKYRHTWELVEIDNQHLACINTGLPNKLVKEAIDNGVIEELQGYQNIKAEVKYGEASRIDWLLSNNEGKELCYVEVKNATLLEEGELGEGGHGYFPDAVTDRGRKHLFELVNMVKQGHRAVLCFCVSHTGINKVSPAAHIDEKYTQALKEVMAQGVEVIAYRARITPEEIELTQKLPVIV
ncbi:putative regulator for maltose metabolism [Marinomonas sp. MED121]|uniref:DNA/RNA nuclease SfsA n=1 Tax=Marinomonas sp. MED121 TaxID=314277 RepID=UPI00006902CE|nr:DNA/RNA nuclease SfsA [Marinomonas sp. MED121]EAQ66325.1 putative regulator for maltose metabolism [Marinomonas sp. MED121]